MKIEKRVFPTGYTMHYHIDKYNRCILLEDSDGYRTWRVFEGDDIIYELFENHSKFIVHYTVLTKNGRFVKDVRHVLNYYPTKAKPGMF